MPYPPETVFDQIWTQLDGFTALNDVIRHKYKFTSREVVPPANPTTGQLPDLTVIIEGGPLAILETNKQWRPSLRYDVIARTDSMNPRTAANIAWLIALALTNDAGTASYNLTIPSIVTKVDFEECIIEKDDTADRWIVRNPITVTFRAVPSYS